MVGHIAKAGMEDRTNKMRAIILNKGHAVGGYRLSAWTFLLSAGALMGWHDFL
jgi:hypothetical protein